MWTWKLAHVYSGTGRARARRLLSQIDVDDAVTSSTCARRTTEEHPRRHRRPRTCQLRRWACFGRQTTSSAKCQSSFNVSYSSYTYTCTCLFIFAELLTLTWLWACLFPATSRNMEGKVGPLTMCLAMLEVETKLRPVARNTHTDARMRIGKQMQSK